MLVYVIFLGDRTVNWSPIRATKGSKFKDLAWGEGRREFREVWEVNGFELHFFLHK